MTANSSTYRFSENRSSDMVINQLFIDYHIRFINHLCANYGIDRETASDLCQDSFYTLTKKVRDGSYQPQKGVSMCTYLFAIGKRKACNWLREHGRMDVGDVDTLCSEWITENYEETEQEEAQKIANQLVGEAQESCRKILLLYYWKSLNMKEIAQKMNLKNDQNAKNKKSKCLRKFKLALMGRLKEAEIEWKSKDEKDE